MLGAILCSLVILCSWARWRMTAIADHDAADLGPGGVGGLYFTGQTINVMTLAGLTLAIGPMIDSAIICLENTHRHLGLGATPHEAAFLGASEVAMPELVSTLCTFLVLSPLALTPGLGQFLFKPMAMAVAFCDDRGLHPVADPGAGLLRPTGSSGARPRPRRAVDGHGTATASRRPEAETFTINGNGTRPRRAAGVRADRAGVRPLGADDRRAASSTTSAASTSSCGTAR